MRRRSVLGKGVSVQKLRVLGLLLIGVLVCAAQATIKGLTISVEPAFDPPLASSQGAPLEITLTNDGEALSGELKVEGDYSSMRYPVELPSGSKKAWIAYVNLEFDDLSVSLITNRGRQSTRFETESFARRSILLLGGFSGQLGFLQTGAENSFAEELTPAYWRTKLAPDRTIAFMNYSAVVLGEGAERLPDATIEAVKGYVLAGGCLIVPTGPGLPIFQDPRLSMIWGPQSVDYMRIGGSDSLAAIGGSPVKMEFGITKGFRGGEAFFREDGVPLVNQYRFGRGTAFLLAFDPLDGPMTKWPGRAKLIGGLVRMSATLTNLPIVLWPLRGRDTDYGGYPPPEVSSEFGLNDQSAFNIQPPASRTIFWVLGLFVVIVVPLNFFILGAIKKREWAWFTSPVISIVFAVVFFRVAGQLHQFGQSIQTSASIYADLRSQNAVVVGTNKLFFPKAGRYDLGLQRVEHISIQNERFGSVDFRPIDTGTVQCPEVVMGALTFTKVAFFGNMDVGPLLQGITRTRTRDGFVVTLNPPPGLSVQPGDTGVVPKVDGRQLVWTIPTKAIVRNENRQTSQGNPLTLLNFRVTGLRLGVTNGQEVAAPQGGVEVFLRMPEDTP